MVAPAYGTDLTVITTDNNDNGWAEMTGHKSGGAPAIEQDYFIEGIACISQSTGTATGTAAGMSYANPAGPLTTELQPNSCFFVWQVLLAGNGIYPFEQGGLSFYMGDGDGAWYGYKTGGDNFGRNPYGGWFNAAVCPLYEVSGVRQYDYVEGAPTDGTYENFASLPNLRNAISKGNPHAVDTIAYGRGALIVSGGSLGDGHCSFTGAALANDDQNARWGLFQEQTGAYLAKGNFQIGVGRDVTATATSAAFVDSNKVITIDQTPRTYRTFNKFEINNTGTHVYWDNILITAASGGGLSRGIIDVGDTCTGKYNGYSGVNFESCVFTDMFETILRDNCSMNNTIWRRTGTVYQNSAEFNGCTFDTSPSGVSLLVNNIETVLNCDFVSDGLNHGIELTEDHIQGGSYSLTGNTYTGYASVSGSTGNESIYNNSGNLITLNVIGGDVPTIRNGEGANTQVIVATTYTVSGLVSGSEIQIVTQDSLDDGTVSADENLWHEESVNTDDGQGQNTYKSTYTYNYTADIPIYVYIHKLGYEWQRVTDTLIVTSKSVPVSQKRDRVYKLINLINNINNIKERNNNFRR